MDLQLFAVFNFEQANIATLFVIEDTWRFRPCYWRYREQHVTYSGT